jgi:hypothetical protein
VSARREAFSDFFVMAHNSSAVAAAATAQASQVPLAPPPRGTITKAGFSLVAQRCVPSASDADLRYSQLLLDTALPNHAHMEPRDIQHALKQGCQIEELVAEGRLPNEIKALLAKLASQFLHRDKGYQAFQALDLGNRG